MATIRICDRCKKHIEAGNIPYKVALVGIDYEVCASCKDQIKKFIMTLPIKQKTYKAKNI